MDSLLDGGAVVCVCAPAFAIAMNKPHSDRSRDDENATLFAYVI